MSVRRRDRCTRTALIRFAVSCLVLLHAPPPLLSSVRFVPCSGPAHFAFHLLCLCCPPSLCLSFASLHVLPCEARVIVLSLCSCGFASSSFLFFCAPRCACAGPGGLLSFVVVPVSVLPAFPPPRVVLFVLWSSLYPGVLVLPSEYLVAAVTAQLPCFHAGSVVTNCYPSVIRFMAPKATGPVWAFHPLHHVTDDVGELSSAILRYSP